MLLIFSPVGVLPCISTYDIAKITTVNFLLSIFQKFSVGDRAGLLNDAFSLADATQLSYDIALDMTAYLAKETDYVPWSVAASKLTSLKRLLMFTEVFGNYKKYAHELIKPIYENVTWTVGDDHLKKYALYANYNR